MGKILDMPGQIAIERPDIYSMSASGPRDSTSASRRSVIDRRREPRADAEDLLRSDFGRVADLSLHGVRLLTQFRWAEGTVRRVSISSASRTLVADARCVWCRQEGLHDHLVGLTFGALSEEQADTVRTLLEEAGWSGG